MQIHETADVQTSEVGEGTQIWQHVVVLPGARIGKDVNINAHCFVENDVTIGDRVTIKSGVYLWDGVHIADDVFVGPNVTFTNDKFPRSKRHPETFLQTKVEAKASIGAGAVILPGLTVGTGAMVGAGSVVTKSVPPYAIVVGSPARIKGYVDGKNSDANADKSLAAALAGTPTALNVKDVTLHRMKRVIDIRGTLSVGELDADLPFAPKRYFLVYDVPSVETRGAHAHRRCRQFLICVKGSCSVVVDDGSCRAEVQLDAPDKGLYLPPLVWGIQFKFTSDAVLLVFASDLYDPDDYIRDYATFVEAVESERRAG